MKAYLLTESLDRLVDLHYESCDTPVLTKLDQLRWQRLRPFEKLAQMCLLLDHLEGILNYCHQGGRGHGRSRERKYQEPA